MKTTAHKDGEHYILNGTKAWVTSGKEAKAGVIFATVDKKLNHKGIAGEPKSILYNLISMFSFFHLAFVVPFNEKGLSLGRREDKMGIRASSTCDVTLDDVRVSNKNRLGDIGEGFVIAMEQLQLARIGVAAQALGIAQASLDLAVSYAIDRSLFGKQLLDMQLVKVRSEFNKNSYSR